MRLVLAALVATTAVAAAQPSAKVDPAFAKSGIADWSKPPAPTKEPRFVPPVPKRLKLRNGMAVLVVPNRALPIVSMTLVVPGAGAAMDPAGKSGLAAYTTDMLDEGAAGLSAIEIAEEIDRLGASFGAGAGVDTAQVSMSTLSKTLDGSLDLFTKIVTSPTFDDKEAERVKGDRATSLELRRDRPREVVGIMLNAALYGAAKPYGRPTAGTREDFKTITIADARTFYRERWNPATMTLVVAGDVDAAALEKRLQAGLGAWKPAGAKRAARPDAKPAKPGARLLLADRPGAAQSDVRIGLVGLPRKDRRYYQFEVFRTVLGDGFTSRLVQRLREQLGITYGASAYQEWRLATGPFVIATAIVTPQTGTGLKETFQILDSLATTDLSADELDKAKQNLIRALPGYFETNSSVVAAYVDLVVHGLPDTWYTTYAANIRRVRAADVKAIAKAIVPSKRVVVAIVGDLAKIRADLEKLDLGAPLAHDLYGTPRP